MEESKTVTFTQHTEANINFKTKTVTFWGREGGWKSCTYTFKELFENTHLTDFYHSERLAAGILSRVMDEIYKF